MLLLLLLAFLPLLWLSLVPGSACQHRTPVNSWIRQVKTTIAYSKNKIDCNSFNLYIYSHQLTCFTPLNDQNQKQEKFWILLCESEYRNLNIIDAKVLPGRVYYVNGYTIVTKGHGPGISPGYYGRKQKENTVKHKELCSSAVSHLLNCCTLQLEILVTAVIVCRFHSLKNSLNFRGSPWKVLEFHFSSKIP